LVVVAVVVGVYLSTSGPAWQNGAAAETSARSKGEALTNVKGIPVPALPFDDNPDPLLCGIPRPWTGQKRAWLSGYYDGKLIQPTVYLYDSHLRREVVAAAPTGAEVAVSLYQVNPTLNYYLVNLPGGGEGWVPAPFLAFEPPG
jgi:hypothetical protein